MSEEQKLQLLHQAHYLLFDEMLPIDRELTLDQEMPIYLSSSIRYIKLLQKQVEALTNLKIK